MEMVTFKGPRPKFMVPSLSSLQEVTYAINALDQVSLRVGTFAFDDNMYELTGSFFAISPVYDSVDAFYDAMRAAGFTQHSYEKAFTISR